MKTCVFGVFVVTKGSAGRAKFAGPQTSGARYFKQLGFFFFFFLATRKHICIHPWTKKKSAARSVPAVDFRKAHEQKRQRRR